MSTQATRTDPVTQRLQKTERLIATGKYPEAAEELAAVEKASPGDPRVYLLLSRLAEINGNPKAAVEAMRHALKAMPGWIVAVIEMALLLARQNQFQEAIQYATRAVELAPQRLEVLTRAVDVAHRAQNFPLALQWLRLASALAPDNRPLKHLIASDLKTLGENTEALAAYTALIESDATDTPALLGRLQVAVAADDKKLAKKDGAALVALDPENEEYAFWNELGKGKTPKTQPASMVRNQFDVFPEMYDQHMVRGLKYQLPKQMAKRITDLYPERKLNVLDLGCGTGLLGVCLGRLDGALVGVDVSEKMIAQAVRHNVYDRFHTVNLLDALKATPKALYDVIAACDVFIYVGDLSKAIPNAFRVLVKGGHLMFSCETAQEDEADLVLRSTLRYAHKPSHIEALCRKAGFDEVSIEATVLRLENHEPVHGFTVVAHKPA